MKKRMLPLAVLFAVALSLGCGSEVSAQSTTDGSTPLALSPGSPAGSYSLGDFDSVSLYDGNLGFGLPLAKVAGRGAVGYTLMARIEHKWLVEKEPRPGQPNLYTPNPNWWNIEGFNSIYSVGRMDMRQAGSTDYHVNSCGYYVHNQTLTRLTFTAPDGTEYELRDQLTNGRADQPDCAPLNRRKVFTTSDGNLVTFTSDSDITDYIYDNPTNEPPSGNLTMRDGTRYRIDGGLVTWMRDRNGNKIAFSYDNGHITTATDSLNRQINISYATQVGSSDEIHLKGFGGAPRTIKVYQSFLHDVLRSGSSLLTYRELFPELNGSSDQPSDPSVISAVELPNGQQYRFYYNSYAELARVVLPTGGAIEYDYAAGVTDGVESGVLANVSGGDKHVYRRLAVRRVYADGGTGLNYETKTTYSRPESSSSNLGYVTVTQSDAADHVVSQSDHYFYGSARGSFDQKPTQYPGYRDGREYRTIQYANGTPLRQVDFDWENRAHVDWWTDQSHPEPPNDLRVLETDTTLLDTNQVSKVTFGYDDSVPFNNRNNVKEYDFGNGVAGALIRETRTTYLTSPNYTASNVSLLGLPDEISVWDGNTERARTKYEYDNYASDNLHAPLVPRSVITGLCGSAPCFGEPDFGSTIYLTRGNVTKITRYLFDLNGNISGSINGYSQYDVAGNIVKIVDPRSTTSNVIATSIDFTDRFGVPDDDEARSNSGASELGSQYSYAFPTLVTNALGHTFYTQFDFYLGRPVNSEDSNGVVSSGFYNDALDRPNRVINGANQDATVRNQTNFSYDDTNRIVTTISDQNSATTLRSQTVYDGLGRIVESRQYENVSDYIAVKHVPFVVLQDGNVWLGASQASNPFRPLLEQPVWTSSFSDSLNRVIKVKTPDSAVVTTSYSGNRVTVIDQINKQRASVTDALGRLKQVFEAPNNGAYNFLTSYEYDVLDDLTRVTQDTQPSREFHYDSLRRLTLASNPESGTVTYQYDSNGNLTQKTDARGVITTFDPYDALNRATVKRYSDGTPTVTYGYDSPSTGNSKGRITSVSSSVSAYNYTSYDALGRVLTSNENIGGQTYRIGYTYDLAGHVKTIDYPSNNSVSYAYDGAGRTNTFSGNLGGMQRDYATEIIYSAMGGMGKEKLGTDTSIYNKLFYNSRGQLAEIREGTSYTGLSDYGSERGAIVNDYSDNCTGMCGGPNSSMVMLDNNGNLKKQEINTSTGGVFTQTYGYDPLNRLSSVNENHNGGGVNWQQTYTYDRFGNRSIYQPLTSGDNINNNQAAVVQNTLTNRMYAPGETEQNHPLIDYDSAGNQKKDYYTESANGVVYDRTYDAENRFRTSTATYSNPPGSVVSEYSYDGDGRRVKRKAGASETWGVYGIGGELLAEYAANQPPGSPLKEYGYRNGQLLITAESSVTKLQPLTVTASHTYGPSNGPDKAVDGNPSTIWSSGDFAQQWIQLDLGQSTNLSKVRLQVTQAPNGHTTHQILGGPTSDNLSVLGTFDVDTFDGQWLELNTGATGVRYLKVLTTLSPSWVGWREIEVYGTPPSLTKINVSSASDSQDCGAGCEVAHTIDGNLTSPWISGGFAPQWVQLDLGQVKSVSKVRLLTAQTPAGPTTHEFYGGTTENNVTQFLGTLDGNTSDYQWLEFNFTATNIRYLKVKTTSSPSWVAWYEIEVYGPPTSGPPSGVHWLVTDQLGTPRMIFDQSGSLTVTDQNGNYVSGMTRHDYLPFGEQVPANFRSGISGYETGDNVRQKFTGYEADGETKLNFAQARYQSTMQGRFTSADPLMASAAVADPQSLNRYSYVQNSPTNFADPSGMALSDIGVYQTNDPELADSLQRQSDSDYYKAINEDYKRRHPRPGGVVGKTGNVVGQVTIYGHFEDNWGNPDYAAMSAALWGLARSGYRFGAAMGQYIPTPHTMPDYGGGYGHDKPDATNFMRFSFGYGAGSVGITRDVDHNWYFSFGPSLGIPKIGVSLSGGTTYDEGGDPVYDEERVKAILSGPSSGFACGAGVVLGRSWNNPSLNIGSVPILVAPLVPKGGSTREVGIGNPQLNVGGQLTFRLFRW